MKYSFTKALILKPQASLLVFIHNQLPNFNWKQVKIKKLQNTAYIIPDFNDEVEMLFNLQAVYIKIFRNELEKLVGSKLTKKINLSFVDFLNCFKFDYNQDLKFFKTKIFKKICIKQKNLDIFLNFQQLKTTNLEEICEILAELNSEKQIILVKDLSGKKFGLDFFALLGNFAYFLAGLKKIPQNITSSSLIKSAVN